MKLFKDKTVRYAAGVILLMGLYTLILGTTCHLKYHHLAYDDFDLAVHTQSLRSILMGSAESSILGIPFLGNHMVLILYLIAPLYALFPSAVLLLYIQTIALAAGAWAIYRIAQRELSPAWGLSLAAAYVIYPPLIYLNLYEFHPIALASTFILFAMLHWKENAFGRFLLMLALAASCQENIALLAIGFGVFALFERKRWWWAATPLAFGTAYFGIVVMHIMPRLNDTVNFQSLYAHLGRSMPEIAANVICHPVETLRIVTEPAKLSFIRSLFAPLGFLSVLSPLTWIPAGLIVAQRLLSNRTSESMVVFHYQAEFIPFIFVSAIYAIRRLRRLPSKALNLTPTILIICFPILAAVSGRIVPLLQAHWATPPGGAILAEAKRDCVRQIPANKHVAATFEFLSYLADTPDLHSIHHISSGYYTLSTKPYPTPDNLDFILIDTNDRLTFSPSGFYHPEIYIKLQALLKAGQWELAEQSETLIALRRTPQPDDSLPLARTVAVIPASASTRVTQEGDTGVRLRAFNANPEADGVFSTLTLFWETATTPPADADMLLTIEARGEMRYEAILSPGSRFWPPQSWPPQAIVADRHRIPIEANAPDTTVSVKMLPMTQQRGR
jgi:uncharacterized membrane protein